VNLSRLGKESGWKFDVFPVFHGDALFLTPLLWTMHWPSIMVEPAAADME
jgi:hypothetical protein